MDPAILRALERILVVLVGGLSVYLGYRLLLQMPTQQDSEGKVVLPGGISIYMSRVGPGAFFGLFGATVVAFSLHYAITYTEASTPAPVEAIVQAEPNAGTAGASLPVRRTYTGIGEGETEASVEDRLADRGQLRLDMDFVNGTLPKLLRHDVAQSVRDDLGTITRRIKLALMKASWDSSWGDYDEFRQWVEGGKVDLLPPRLTTASVIYHNGQEDVP